MITTVAAILANPRYTGRQVWNRQHTDRHEMTGQAELFEQHDVQRWTASTQWAISRSVAHPPLISEEQFVRAQAVHTAPTLADGIPRDYRLAGLVYCGICGRLMDSHWVHGRAGYRCRHGRTSAQPASPNRPKILYVREDQLLDRIRSNSELRRQLGGLVPHAVANFLRAGDMIIVCDHQGWAVESDTTRIDLAPTTGSAGRGRSRRGTVDRRRSGARCGFPVRRRRGLRTRHHPRRAGDRGRGSSPWKPGSPGLPSRSTE